MFCDVARLEDVAHGTREVSLTRVGFFPILFGEFSRDTGRLFFARQRLRCAAAGELLKMAAEMFSSEFGRYDKQQRP